jgi:hypothetical protein
MIRIGIEWNFISPFLQTMMGQLIVEDIDNNDYNKTKNVFQCTVKKEPGSLEFSSIESNSISSDLFELIKDQIDDMIHSYFGGMMLKKQQSSWVSESLSMPLEIWIKKRENYLKEVKHEYGLELLRQEKKLDSED